MPAAQTLRPRKGQGRIEELNQDLGILNAADQLLRVLTERHPQLVGNELRFASKLLDDARVAMKTKLHEAQQAQPPIPEQT